MKDVTNQSHHHHGEHYSQRAGHNRRTKSQKLRRFWGNLLFAFLSIIALLIILFIAYDHWVGVF